MSSLYKKGWVRKLGLALLDVILVVAALFVSLVLRYETTWNIEFANTFHHLIEIIFIYMAVMTAGGLYHILWRYAGVNEAIRLALICLLACGLTILANHFLRWSVSRAVLCILALLAALFIIASRMMSRKLAVRGHNAKGSHAHPGPRSIIVGAGMTGSYILNMCRSDIALGQPILFVDDDPLKIGQRVKGIRVMGKLVDIPRLVEQYEIQDIIIAIPSLKGAPLNRLIALCRETGCRVRISSRIQSSDDAGQGKNLYVREPNISDFLSREEIHLDTQNISGYLTGKTVLVTGGGGSIGSELCRQILRFSPRLLLVFDIYENCAYELACEMQQKYGQDCPILVLIGSVRDRERLNEVFSTYHPNVVFHAAAHKHVPLMEMCPGEAVKNNVFGTWNVLAAADAFHTERLVSLSTDKAVNPTNVMGASKRITEMLIQYYSRRSQTKYMAVRFGNVLGSHGSVIPLFEEQIKSGGPVTITHPDIIRYFMTIPEAAQLVLEAGSIAISGSIFVLDMGEPVRIQTLAEQLIRFYGFEPGVSMEIIYTGLRPGEKLYEELLTFEEKQGMQRTSHDKIMIAPPMEQEDELFKLQLETLRAADGQNDEHVVEVMKVIVPEFARSCEEKNNRMQSVS